ncbi:MAG TPA: DUF2961 domain-containing protein [bacterium]|nr:DUF2961 domain-containing protein [bacterium]HPO10286.1 DUF2961 domain-containing protein [bacterium]HQP99092.1 DUF2961 domain-containing protein [bacterium]
MSKIGTVFSIVLLVVGFISSSMDVRAQPRHGTELASPLDSIARLRNSTSKRISSFDRTGLNADRLTIEPGETATLAEIKGAGCIKHIWFTISHTDKLYRRNMVLRMYWDGEKHPSVESPVGDFFGQGWGEEYLFNSLPLAASPGGGKALNCYFPMPFAESAKITIENQSDQKCNAFYYFIDYEEMPKLDRDVLQFHAWWNHELTMPSKGDENEWATLRKPEDANTTGEDNYLILSAEGTGHYVGVNYYVHSPTPMWPGEGDDLFLVDGEKWPGSLHGTGTEDYFNCSWCPKEIFMHPFFGYARVNDNTGWLGRTHSYRFHLQDPVTFQKSLQVSIEHGHANCLTLDLATVAYWYQTEPHKPLIPLQDPEKRKPMPEIGVIDIHRWREAWRQSKGGGVLWGNEQ